MMRMKNVLGALAFCALTAGCVRLPPVADMQGGVSFDPAAAPITLPFTLDDNRVFVEIAFLRPDGTPRKALAFVNQGQGGLVLSNTLFRELAPRPGRKLHLKFGTLDVAVDGAAAQPESLSNDMAIGLDPFGDPPAPDKAAQGAGGQMAGFAAPLPVEAIIPPGLLQHFQVVFDYGAKTMTLAAPGTLKPDGVAVPIRVDPRTGFAMLDVTIDGARHVFVLDGGGSYSGIRSAEALLAAHPDWLRATGGVGEANLTMQDSDAGAPVLRAPHVTLGALRLDEVGLLQMGQSGLLGGFVTGLFWDRIYSVKAGEPVDGMLSGNVLRRFRLTIDYPNRMTWWLEQAPPDAHELDQVGLTLARWNGAAAIAGIVRKNGAGTVGGVAIGDKLLQIDGRVTSGMTRGALLAALHGAPGETRRLTLERDGKEVVVAAPVTAF